MATRVRGLGRMTYFWWQQVCLLLAQCGTLGGCNLNKTVHGEKVHRKFRPRAEKRRLLACVAGGIVSVSYGRGAV